ncbi:MAG: hypothetical protein PHQ27_08625 [Victivallales bacterium]|nr:hypothetical protein [Victivallales bacterium]
MKDNKKKELRNRESLRPGSVKALFIDLNDQLQLFLHALKTSGSEDNQN